MKKVAFVYIVILTLWLLVYGSVIVLANIAPWMIPGALSWMTPHQEITVTAKPHYLGVDAPSDFTVWYISDNTVGMSWAKASSANNTLIRAKYSEYPANKDDGYLVYYGMDSSANDTATNFYPYLGRIYYCAYSENTTGGWSSNYAQADIEGPAVSDLNNTILDFITFLWPTLLVFTIGGLAFWHRDRVLYILAGFAFILYGFSIYQVALYMSIILVLAGIYCFIKAKWDKRKIE